MINETHIETKFAIGELVQHKFLAFRGVIFDIDPSFNNTEEWYLAIPKDFRPRKDQPFYHLLADNGNMFYNAYVSEQNLALTTDALTGVITTAATTASIANELTQLLLRVA